VRLEIIPGNSLALVDEKGNRNVFDYCENDLADEVVGMWVNNNAPAGDEGVITIKTFKENGKSTFTGYGSSVDGYVVKDETDYKVVGDLLFYALPQDMLTEGECLYTALKLTYAPNGNSLGDIMVQKSKKMVDGKEVERTSTMLRVKQNLSLAGKAYDYSATYISNAKGADKDIPFLDTKFNFAHMDGSIIDKFLKSVLYNVQFPDAKTFQYNCLLEGQNVSLQLPMEVEGNKITIKMSSRHEAYRDVVVYAFQDVDGCQFHMYMPTASFENFFSNLSLSILSASGQVDINNPVHVDAVYKEVADAIESINVSIVMK
jgi:hypothetical protein